eukprot:g8934.t1
MASATRKKSKTSRNTSKDTGVVVNPYAVLWHPPLSPYGLLEEELYADPWKLLVGCMLLNKTAGVQVRRVIWKFFAKWPDARSAMEAESEHIAKVIEPLGLGKKRAGYIKKFSQEYLQKRWRDPRDLTGLGKYASDAYFIFCKVCQMRQLLKE